MRCTIAVWLPSALRKISSKPGSLLRTAGLIAAGSIVPSQGAARPMSRMIVRIAAPATTTGLRNRRRNDPLDSTGAVGAIAAESSTMLISIANAWVEHGVHHVDQQIDEHVHECKKQDHRLHCRVIAREHRIDSKPAQPRDAENAFGDDDAADEQRDADADHGDDRHGGVAQGMPHEYHAIGKT